MRRSDREVTEPNAILAIIEAADSCRLGLVDNSGPVPLPYIVALNFGYEPSGADGLYGTFWFHGATKGHKLDLIRNHPHAVVQFDGEHKPVKHALGCGWGMKYASVVAHGQAHVVDDPAERRRGLGFLMAHYVRLWGPPDGHAAADGTATSLEMLPLEESALATTTVFRMDVQTLCAKRKG